MSRSVKSMIGVLVFVAVAGCASTDYEDKYNQANREALDAATQIDAAKTENAKAQQRAAALEQQTKSLEQQKLDAQKRAEEAAARAAELDARLRQGPATAAAPEAPHVDTKSASLTDSDIQRIADQLRKELPLTEAERISVSKDGNIEIQLPSDVSFASGSADLSEAGKKSLKAVVPALKGRWAPYQVRVEGHTDSTPLTHTKSKFHDNFGLGSARSLSVVRFLEGELGLDPKRLMSASLGEHKPVVEKEKTNADKAKNRRVELVVIIPRDAAQAMGK